MISINEQEQVRAWLEAERKGDRFPVDFDIAWVMAGYAMKHHAKRRLTNQSSYLVLNEDYKIDKGAVLITQSGESTISGRSSDRIVMTCDAFKHFCLMAQTAKGRDVRQYFIEAEKTLLTSIPTCQLLNEELQNLRQQLARAQRPAESGKFQLHCDKLPTTYRYTLAVQVSETQYIELMHYTLPEWIAQETDYEKFKVLHKAAIEPITELMRMLNRMSREFTPIDKPAITRYANR
jgi:phage anti-repressor protein